MGLIIPITVVRQYLLCDDNTSWEKVLNRRPFQNCHKLYNWSDSSGQSYFNEKECYLTHCEVYNFVKILEEFSIVSKPYNFDLKMLSVAELEILMF